VESQPHVSTPPTRDVTLDAARGVGIILVLLRHTQPLAGFGFFASTALLGGSLLYWVNGLLSLVCVPLLYTVSLFLLFARCSKSPLASTEVAYEESGSGCLEEEVATAPSPRVTKPTGSRGQRRPHQALGYLSLHQYRAQQLQAVA
jgi:hypothetical protein